MTDTIFPRPGFQSTLRHLWQEQRVWLASALILGVLAVFDTPLATDSALFAGTALLNTAPFLILSITIAAWANATGADNLIAKAFTGAPILMIGLGALAGGISPFCSCGVIPLIAALLAMGVPLFEPAQVPLIGFAHPREEYLLPKQKPVKKAGGKRTAAAKTEKAAPAKLSDWLADQRKGGFRT